MRTQENGGEPGEKWGQLQKMAVMGWRARKMTRKSLLQRQKMTKKKGYGKPEV